MATNKKFIPGSDVAGEEIFKYPYFNDDESKQFINNHGKIMFIVRGPPGTGKGTLTEMMLEHYPAGVVCSADHYFEKTFAGSIRTKESLKKSHDYCHKRVEEECNKCTSPIIVSNTHIKKMEMQDYLNYAALYGYTVIIASTLDKFKVSSEILAKSNTKGLSKEYFDKRMKMWQVVFPLLTGWFLCFDDSYYLLNDLKCALNALLGDGKFCRVFNAFDSEQLYETFQAKEILFCIAGYHTNLENAFQQYYKSDKVKESYGKCWKICILGYTITESDIFAIIQLDEFQKCLRFDPEPTSTGNVDDDDDIDQIANSFRSFSVQNAYQFKAISLNDKFSVKHKTIELEKGGNFNNLNINNLGFIHIAQKGKKPFSASKMARLFKNCFVSVSQASGKIDLDQFSEIEGDYSICRLPNNIWLIKTPKIISIKTVFTGLYI